MASDPNKPVVLATVPNEGQASLIVAALEGHDVHAHVQGALTSGFRAEVPGQVQVVVRQADLERGLEIMQLTGQGPVENC